MTRHLMTQVRMSHKLGHHQRIQISNNIQCKIPSLQTWAHHPSPTRKISPRTTKIWSWSLRLLPVLSSYSPFSSSSFAGNAKTARKQFKIQTSHTKSMWDQKSMVLLVRRKVCFSNQPNRNLRKRKLESNCLILMRRLVTVDKAPTTLLIWKRKVREARVLTSLDQLLDLERLWPMTTASSTTLKEM